MKIYEIDFAFENCEDITISGRYVFCLHIGNTITEYHLLNQGLSDTVDIHNVVEDCTVGILNEAKDNAGFDLFLNDSEFEKEYFNNRGLSDYYEKLGRLHRLDGNDLTQVEIKFWDGYNIESIIHKHFYVKWKGSDYENDLEKTYVNKFGDILISVNPNNDREDFEDYMFKHFSKEALEKDYWMNCVRDIRNLAPKGDTSRFFEVQREIKEMELKKYSGVCLK